jgi:hypothetical protein
MFSFLRPRVRFAGRIGWIDGRRGYPSDEQFVELVVQRSAAQPGQPDPVGRALPDEALPTAAVHPLAAGPRR